MRSTIAFRCLVTSLYAFLLAAPLVVIYYSFSPGVVLEVPPRGLTLSWYLNFLDQPRLVEGTLTSLVVASVSTLLALLVGIPAAYALARSDLPGRHLLAAALLSPLNLPGLVLAMGMLMFLVAVIQPLLPVSLVGRLPPLLAAHLIITIPWVVRTVTANLETVDRAPEEAARGLGATPAAAFFLVTLPMIRPGVAAASLFAFIVSFGNFALSLFFTSGGVTTLPVAIFEYIDQFQDPTIAAVSSLVIVATSAVVIAAHRVAGFTRPARSERGGGGRTS